MSIKKHIPNILSTIRLVMAIGLPFVFLNTSLLFSLIYYLIGDATDLADGFLARKWKVQSKYGKIVDPVADKSLNVIALFFTSLIVNPLMFVLIGLEALIASISILRVNLCKKKLGYASTRKGVAKIMENMSFGTKAAATLDVAFVGKAKSFALLFATISTLMVPIVPAFNMISNVLIGVAATLQVFTAGQYLREYSKERKNTPITELETTKDDSTDIEADEVKKLEHAKQLLATLSTKAKAPVVEENSLIETNFQEKTNQFEDQGISRTLKK